MFNTDDETVNLLHQLRDAEAKLQQEDLKSDLRQKLAVVQAEFSKTTSLDTSLIQAGIRQELANAEVKLLEVMDPQSKNECADPHKVQTSGNNDQEKEVGTQIFPMTVVQGLVTSEKDSTPKTPQRPTVIPSPNTIAAVPHEVATMRKTKNAELRRMVKHRKA